MKTDYLRELIELVFVGNFSTAADNMFMTQASLSRHIQAIEEELGVVLLDRGVHRISLTKAGEIFLPHAKKMIACENEYRRDLTELKNNQNITHLHISIFSSGANYHISDMVQAFVIQHGEVRIDMINTNEMLQEKLLSQEIDFAFVRNVNSSAISTQLQHIHITDDYIAAILDSRDPLSEKKELTFSDLKGRDLLLMPMSSPFYNMCINRCEDAGFYPNVVFTSTKSAATFSLVSSGFGVALLPYKSSIEIVDNDTSVKIRTISPQIDASVDLIYNPVRNTYYNRLFLNHIRKSLLDYQTEYPEINCKW